MIFSKGIQMLKQTQPPPKGPRPPVTPSSSRAEPVPLDGQNWLAPLLKAVPLQNLLGMSSDPSPFLHHPKCSPMKQQVPERTTTRSCHKEPGTWLSMGAKGNIHGDFLVLLPPSQVKSRDGCCELCISSPFAFLSHQGLKKY